MRFPSAFLLLATASMIVTAAETTHHHLMMVVSKGLPGVTIFDADTDQPICSAKLGISPHEGAFSRDGKFAYVPVYGSTAVGKAGTDEHTLHFIRTSDCKEMGVLDTGENKRPHGISVGKDGMIFLTSEVSQSLLLIDAKQRKIIGKIPTDSPYSHTIAVTPDEKKVYVSNVQSKTVSVLDVPGRKLTKVIQTGAENQRMVLSPDGQWFVTSLGAEQKVAFYRTSDNELDFTVPVEGKPFVARFSADGKYVYDAGHQDGQIRVWKIDVAGRKVVGTTSGKLGSATGSLEVNPFNHEVYVTDQTTNQISQIDPDTLALKKQVPTEKTPDCIGFVAVR